jgi:hypothetical protein
MKQRIEIQPEIVARILVASSRTCCVCNEPGKGIQIHHIDEDPSNNDPSNLAVLCFDCHGQTQIKGGFGRKLDADQILLFKAQWDNRVRERRAKADEVVVTKLSGIAPQPASVLEKRNRIPNESRLANFIKLLPAMKKEVYSRERAHSTRAIVRHCRDCIDILRQILSNLFGWYPPNHFSETGNDDFIDSLIALSYRKHAALEEPLGYRTGGSMVRILAAGWPLRAYCGRGNKHRSAAQDRALRVGQD